VKGPGFSFRKPEIREKSHIKGKRNEKKENFFFRNLELVLRFSIMGL